MNVMYDSAIYTNFNIDETERKCGQEEKMMYHLLAHNLTFTILLHTDAAH